MAVIVVVGRICLASFSMNKYCVVEWIIVGKDSSKLTIKSGLTFAQACKLRDELDTGEFIEPVVNYIVQEM